MKRKVFFVLFVSFVFFVGNVVSLAQMPNIPLNPQCRKGVLPNGLTYYIQHNEWPEQRADFYIAQKVGSMQEEDDQRGLAHFLEHMCFNGTTHFPGDALKSYLESIGVKFGEDLNAYTSTDETVYNINNVPVISHPGALDSCLLILHDWSHDLLLEGGEIDKERGVINEEWRSRQGAQMRMYDQVFPILYKDSKYAYRLPIGTMDVVMNFKYKTLREYYKKWYRPDLQGIVVVGDIDVDQVEQKIKDMFADIKPVKKAAERVYFPVPDNDEPILAVGKDKEQPQTQIVLMWKKDAVPDEEKSSFQYLMIDYVKTAIETMLDTRFQELLQKPNPPFIMAQAGYDKYLIAKTKDAFMGIAVCADNGYEDAVKALYREILRAKNFGFTATEYERFKEELKSNLENQFQQKDKIRNSALCQQYYRNFLDNEPAMGIEVEYQLYPMLADQIPVEAINEALRESDYSKNLAMLCFLPDKEGIVTPALEQFVGYLKAVEAEEIEAYAEEVSNEPLVDVSTLTGSRTESQEAGDFDSQVLTLANGIKIWVKHTDYKPNNISFRAISWGGQSLYGNDEWLNADKIDMVPLGGFGQFSAIDLSKKLAGKQVGVDVEMNQSNEGLSGDFVTKDLETQLQLIYLYFTSPRKDVDAYTSQIQRAKAALENAELQPTTALQDTVASVVYNNNVRALRTKPADLDRLDYDRILEMYQERYADANDFQFYFVGDIDIEAAKPLFEQYLGSLPVKEGSEKAEIIDLRIADGEKTNVFDKPMETPLAVVVYFYHADNFPVHDQKARLTLDYLEQIMDYKYTETIREDAGGAYSVGVSSSVSDYPEPNAFVQVTLPTSPDKREKMTQLVYAGVDDMIQNGPTEEQMSKAREYLHRSHDENLKKNGYWMGQLVEKTFRSGNDYVSNFDQVVDSITAADVKAMAEKVFRSGNRLEIGMNGTEK